MAVGSYGKLGTILENNGKIKLDVKFEETFTNFGKHGEAVENSGELWKTDWKLLEYPVKKPLHNSGKQRKA